MTQPNQFNVTLTRIRKPANEGSVSVSDASGIQINQIMISKKPTMTEMTELLAPFNLGQTKQCIKECRQFIQKFPNHYFGYKLLGACYEQQNKLLLAIEAMQKATQLQPKDIEGMANLAKVYKDVGRHEDALTLYQKALELDPNHIALLAKYLFSLNYANITPANHAFELAQRYGQLISQAASHHYRTWHPFTGMPLRVGLVSGDLNMHPVGFFLENVLAHLDPQHLHITAYPSDRQTDRVTARLRRYCQAWTPIYDLSDSSAAQRIHNDRIDVLIDLSGLTAHNRLGVFAHKPAPVQISWLGYFATTGLPEMDYLLADEESIPTDQEAYFSEKIIRLPHTRLCYGGTHIKRVDPVSPLPALQTTPQQITFGCFQSLSKITDDVLKLWARILNRLPNAHLHIQNRQFNAKFIQDQFIQRCVRNGLPMERLSTHASSGFRTYMNTYARIDMILDTFPFPGGTTTCEALWMGVPTLTMRGKQMIARQGASLLRAAGLDDWIAHDSDEYERKAIAFATDLPALAQLRGKLRKQVSNSPLFNAKQFAADLTHLISETHQRHTSQQITANHNTLMVRRITNVPNPPHPPQSPRQTPD